MGSSSKVTAATGFLILAAGCGLRQDPANTPNPGDPSGAEPPPTLSSPAPILLPTELPTASPVPRPPSQPTPTSTPDPDAALIDSPAWQFELAPGGVYVMNPDSSGRRLLVPYQPMVHDLGDGQPQAFDPWFRVEVAPTGWTAVRLAGVRDDKADPRLYVFKLPALAPVAEIALLAEVLRPHRYDGYYDMAGPEMTDYANLAIHGIWWKTLFWSAEGDRLAFVAAIDGPSADIYLYETFTDRLLRLTDGPNHPLLEAWSPDGRVLVHQEVSSLWSGDGYSYQTEAVWAAATDGSGSVLIRDEPMGLRVIAWLSNTRFVAINRPGDIRQPLFGLELMDVNHGKLETYHAGPLLGWALEAANQSLAFVAYDDSGGGRDLLATGLYLLRFADPVPRHIPLRCPADPDSLCLPREIAWSEELGGYRIELGSDTIGLLSTDGQIKYLGND